ncbi:hypothetical protein JCM6882_009601 [Rhodosporidiobolus microsporus]
MASNPFQDPPSQHYGSDSNPFQDPVVQHGAQSSSAYVQEDDAYSKGASSYSLPQQTAQPDVQARLDDLQRREQELASREQALQNKAEHIRKHGRNNWPPGPFPLLFHDIEQEIPEAHRATVLTLYRIWMFLVLVLIVNLVGAVLLLISGSSNGGADLGAGIMYSFFYYIFFLFGGFHVAFCAYMFVGVPSSGSAGLINLISRFANGAIVSGVFCVLSTVGWALEGLAFLWMFKNVWAHSHGEQGHSLAQAKQEIQMYGLKQYLFKAHSMPASSNQQPAV